MSNTIRLRLAVDLHVDAANWLAEYGTPALRVLDGEPLNVENYVLSLLTECPAANAGALSVDGLAVVVAPSS